MAEQILPEGLRFFNKNEKAPDFVIGTLVVTMNDLFAFCKAHPELVTEYQDKKQLKVQILRSKEGKLYGAVDTWKPGEQSAGTAKGFDAPVLPDETEEKLPF